LHCLLRDNPARGRLAGIMGDERLRLHLEAILQEIDLAISEQTEELRLLQGSSEPWEGLYDPMGLHQKNIDDLTQFRQTVMARLVEVKK
jgi:hypothetical protein